MDDNERKRLTTRLEEVKALRRAAMGRDPMLVIALSREAVALENNLRDDKTMQAHLARIMAAALSRPNKSPRQDLTNRLRSSR